MWPTTDSIVSLLKIEMVKFMYVQVACSSSYEREKNYRSRMPQLGIQGKPLSILVRTNSSAENACQFVRAGAIHHVVLDDDESTGSGDLRLVCADKYALLASRR